MAKDTFYNLSIDKKNMIISVTIDEFYQYGYDKASISRIVEKAGIAKGSFYQYFENKEDLIKELLNYASSIKLEFLQDAMQQANSMKFFDLIEHLCLASLNFMHANPKLAQITDNFLRNANDSLKENVLGANAKTSNAFMEGLLANAIANQEIRDDIEIGFLASYVTYLFFYMSDYLRNNYDDITSISKEEYSIIVFRTIDILKKGIAFVL